MVKIVNATEKHDCEHLLGKFLDDSHYDVLIDEDADVYGPLGFGEENGEHNILFKIRKNVFTEEEQLGAYNGLIDAAVQSQNRGIAAGPRNGKLQNREWVTEWQAEALDILQSSTPTLDGSDPIVEHIKNREAFKEQSSRGLVWLRNRILASGEESYGGFFGRWIEKIILLPNDEKRAAMASEFAKHYISQTTYANPVNSGIAGFFDRYPRIPFGRACAYNEKYPEKFELAFPYLRKLDKEFSTLLPGRHANQKLAASKLDQRFLVAGDTVFTTLTINKTFRTAAHRDAGDLASGFSNLGVINAGKNFKGGYLVLPEYRIAVNIRPGDLLLIANHDAIHGNTEILPAEEGCCPECLIRMSLVCYFREKMSELGSWEYEEARRSFVDSRRLNKDHPMWRPLWNGVSESMWSSTEWYDYLANNVDGGEEMLSKYHPDAGTKGTSLESFFQ